MRSEIIVGLLAVCGAWGCGGDDETTFTPPSSIITPTGTLTGVPGVITSQNPNTSSGLPPGAQLYGGVPTTVGPSGVTPGLVSSTGTVAGQTAPGFTGADSNPFVSGVGTADPFVTGVGSTPFITGAGAASSVGGVGTFSAQDTVADAAPEGDDAAFGGADGLAPAITPIAGLGGAGGEGGAANAGGQGGAAGDCLDH